jgi:NosR/NirI family nitrous oxide reductase transcriptional regulator
MNFLGHNKRKWIATLVASIFFLFFWAYGPLQKSLDIDFVFEQNESPVKPVLITGENHENHYNSKNVGVFKIKGHGFSLIVDHNAPSKESSIITFEESIITNSTYGNKLKSNAIKFYPNKLATYHLKQTNHIFYIEITEGSKRTFYFQSKGISDHIKGYSGPLNVGVFVNESGKIQQSRLISSNETESYLKKISQTDYYHQYTTQDLTKIHKIDAISGATITTKAFALTTTDLIQFVSTDPIEDLTDRIGISNYESTASLTIIWVFEISLVFILFLYAYQKKLRKSKRFVILASLTSVVYIGFFLNESFTYVTFIHPFIGTALSSFMGLYALFVLLGAIWGKNTYCKYICPYGNIQRLQLKLSKGLNKKFFLKNKRIKQVRFTIFFFLAVGILAGVRSLSHLEPFPYIFGVEIQSVWYFTFAVFGLLINWIYPMIWCRLLCPTGSILDTITLISSKK